MAPLPLIPDAAPSQSLSLRLVANPAACHLLKLPRELRDMIWAYTLLEPRKWDRRHKPGCSWYNPILGREPPPFALTTERLKYEHESSPVYFTDSTHECGKRRNLGLLGANRQIRDEAEQIFWPVTTFCFDGPLMFWARTEGVPSVWSKVHKLSFTDFRTDAETSVRLNGGDMFRILRQMPALRALEVPRSFVEHRMVDLMGLPALKTLKVLECELADLALWRPTDLKLWMALGRDFIVPHCYGVVHTQQQFFETSGNEWRDEWDACQVCLPAWQTLRRHACSMRWEVVGDDLWAAKITERLYRKDVSQTAERALMMPVRLRGTKYCLFAEVWGLPTRPVSEHKRLYFRRMREMTQGLVGPQTRPLVSSTSDQDAYPSKSKSARSQRCRQHRAEVEESARVQRRVEKKIQEAKHDAAREKSERKKRKKEMKKAVEQMQAEKKAANRRSGR